MLSPHRNDPDREANLKAKAGRPEDWGYTGERRLPARLTPERARAPRDAPPPENAAAPPSAGHPLDAEPREARIRSALIASLTTARSGKPVKLAYDRIAAELRLRGGGLDPVPTPEEIDAVVAA